MNSTSRLCRLQILQAQWINIYGRSWSSWESLSNMFDQFWAILLQSGMKRKKLFPFMGSQSFIYKSSVIREEPEGTCVSPVTSSVQVVKSDNVQLYHVHIRLI